MAKLDDKELIIRLREGDKESFRVIFEKYYPTFLSFARRLLRDSTIAEDVVQNVFMRLWITRERIDENRDLQSYLLVSVRNEIYTHFRMAFTARRKDDMHTVTEFADKSLNLEDEYSARELEGTVEEAVARMPERRREIFRMSRQQHLTNAQIAEKLGLSVRTVEKHIELALSEIKKVIPLSIITIIFLLW